MLPRRLSACEPGVNYPPLTKKRNLPQMLNKVTLIGYTGKAVEQKYTPGGTAVARVSVATSKRVKKAEKTEASGALANGSEFSEEIADDDVPC